MKSAEYYNSGWENEVEVFRNTCMRFNLISWFFFICGIHHSSAPSYFWKISHLFKWQNTDFGWKASLPEHSKSVAEQKLELLTLSFLLNLIQFCRLYFWSLRGFCIYLLKYIWDYFWHLYTGSWNSMFWHLLASLAICLLQAVILVLLLGMHLTKVLQVCWDLEFCKQ